MRLMRVPARPSVGSLVLKARTGEDSDVLSRDLCSSGGKVYRVPFAAVLALAFKKEQDSPSRCREDDEMSGFPG
jgi:hypothetical protein